MRLMVTDQSLINYDDLTFTEDCIIMDLSSEVERFLFKAVSGSSAVMIVQFLNDNNINLGKAIVGISPAFSA